MSYRTMEEYEQATQPYADGHQTAAVIIKRGSTTYEVWDYEPFIGSPLSDDVGVPNVIRATFRNLKDAQNFVLEVRRDANLRRWQLRRDPS